MSALPEVKYQWFLSKTERCGVIVHLNASLSHLNVFIADIGHLEVDKGFLLFVFLLIVSQLNRNDLTSLFKDSSELIFLNVFGNESDINVRVKSGFHLLSDGRSLVNVVLIFLSGDVFVDEESSPINLSLVYS